MYMVDIPPKLPNRSVIGNGMMWKFIFTSPLPPFLPVRSLPPPSFLGKWVMTDKETAKRTFQTATLQMRQMCIFPALLEEIKEATLDTVAGGFKIFVSIIIELVLFFPFPFSIPNWLHPPPALLTHPKGLFAATGDTAPKAVQGLPRLTGWPPSHKSSTEFLSKKEPPKGVLGHPQGWVAVGTSRPTQDASHHRDDITFLGSGIPYKPSFATVTGLGVDPTYKVYGFGIFPMHWFYRRRGCHHLHLRWGFGESVVGASCDFIPSKKFESPIRLD